MRVFIVWDFTLSPIKNTLQRVADKPPPDVEFEVHGLSSGDLNQGGMFKTHVGPGIDNADRAVVVVDLPNANVGFELGYALGKGKTVALCRFKTDLPKWFAKAPLRDLLIPQVGGPADLRDLAMNGQTVPIPTGTIAPGDGVLFLCGATPDGQAFHEMVEEDWPSWQVQAEYGWTLEDLPERLSGIGTVVWVVPAFPEGIAVRDGPETAAASVIAGFAYARGIEVRIFTSEHARGLGDVAHCAEPFDDTRSLMQKLSAIATPDPGHVDPLAIWRRELRRRHTKLVPFFPDEAPAMLDEVCVQLDLAPDQRGQFASADLRPRKLRALLDPAGGRCGRWIITGDPGAGKTTLARHLTWTLAADTTGPIPVYLPLARLAADPKRPFVMAAKLLDGIASDAEKAAVVEALKGAAPGRIWLLLDGLDEVAPERQEAIVGVISAWADLLPDAVIAVFSRPVAYRKTEHFRRARIQPLSADAQADLLSRWLSDARAAEVQAHCAKVGLERLVANPLMLTLIAMIARGDAPLPLDRGALYDRAVTLLLKRGHCAEKRGVKAPISARRIMGALSLALHRGEGEHWSLEELDEALMALRRADDALNFELKESWGTNEGFLADVARNSGVLAPDDALQGRWRYLHRSLREMLVAEALDRDASALSDVRRIFDDQTDRAFGRNLARRWAEVVLLSIGRGCMGPQDVRRLAKLNNEVARRGLLDGLKLALDDCLDLILEISEECLGDDLLMIAGRWPADVVARGLWRRMTSSTSAQLLALFWYVLENIGEASLQMLKARTGIPKAMPALQWLPIPAGRLPSGDSGSPDIEVPGFQMMAFPVTQLEFDAVMRPVDERSEYTNPIDVNWYTANFFAAICGARLPTGDEWEYACRAGTRSTWWSGDDERELRRVAWYDAENRDGSDLVRPAIPNPWGLLDMHGNVHEWCADWCDDDTRILCGGSWMSTADECGSGVRPGDYPIYRDGYGMRLIRRPLKED